jgi:hypothetical protein
MTAMVTSSECDLRTLAAIVSATAAIPQPKVWRRPCLVAWPT